MSAEDVLSAFPHSPIDQDNVGHYRGRMQRRLLIKRCQNCREWHQPPRSLCPSCWSTEVEFEEVQGRGIVDLATVLHHGARIEGIDYATGYPLAAVALDEQQGLRFTASTVDRGRGLPRIGDLVELVWVERGGVPVPAFALEDRPA